MNWGVGEIEPINDLMRELQVIERDVRFGPGMVVPVTSSLSHAQLVLEAFGRGADDLTWDWPPPYDGPMRRAMLPLPPPGRY
jgi:hypothetical protein